MLWTTWAPPAASSPGCLPVCGQTGAAALPTAVPNSRVPTAAVPGTAPAGGWWLRCFTKILSSVICQGSPSHGSPSRSLCRVPSHLPAGGSLALPASALLLPVAHSLLGPSRAGDLNVPVHSAQPVLPAPHVPAPGWVGDHTASHAAHPMLMSPDCPGLPAPRWAGDRGSIPATHPCQLTPVHQNLPAPSWVGDSRAAPAVLPSLRTPAYPHPPCARLGGRFPRAACHRSPASVCYTASSPCARQGGRFLLQSRDVDCTCHESSVWSPRLLLLLLSCCSWPPGLLRVGGRTSTPRPLLLSSSSCLARHHHCSRR